MLVIAPPTLIKVASNTRPYSKPGGTTLNGREVSIISHRPVTRSDLKRERSFFRGSVSTFLQLVSKNNNMVLCGPGLNICWLSSALKKLQQKEISHLHLRSLLEMAATNTVSSVYQTKVVLMLEKIRLNAVQPKNNARAKSGARSCCAARTRKPQQEAKVPDFSRFNRKHCETQEVKNLYRKKLKKLPQASRRRKKLFTGVYLEEVCGVRCLFIRTSFVALNLSSRTFRLFGSFRSTIPWSQQNKP